MKVFYFLTLLALACTSCRQGSKTTCIHVLVDRTDSFAEVCQLQSGRVTTLLETTTGDNLAGADVHFSPITNCTYSGESRVSIPATDLLSSNEIERKGLTARFVKRLGIVIDSLKKLPEGLPGSSIYEAIAIHLDELATCPSCNTRTLIALGDCRELNCCWLNTYDSSQLADFERNPKRIMALIDQECPVHYSLSGITIYLIHRPLDKADDSAFAIISRLLKAYYEAKGAKVIIGTNINC